MKKTLAMVLALVMMFTLLTGCGGGGGDSGGDGTGAEYTWRMALNGSAPGELGYDMATFFKEKVEELTSGRVSIEFYGGNSLGSTTEVLEGMASGHHLRVRGHAGSLHKSGKYRHHAVHLQRLRPLPGGLGRRAGPGDSRHRGQ